MGWLADIRKQRVERLRAEETLGMLMPGITRRPPDRGTTGMLKAYTTSPWVRAVTSKIATSFGAVEWRLYAARRAGTERGWVKVKRLQTTGVRARDVRRKLVDVPENVELVEVHDHPMLTLLNDPAGSLPGNVSRMLTQLHIELTGEAFWLLLIERVGDAAVPIGYFVVPPTWVTNIPSSGHPLFELTVPGKGTPFNVPMEYMIWFVNPNPADPFSRGSAHMRALGDEIDTDEYAANYIRAWFYNSARPDLLIYGKGMERSDIDQLEAKWMAKLRGSVRAHLPFFLKAAVEVKDLSHKFSDMKIVELRKSERDTIVNARGVPPEILGIIENSNRATISASDYLFNKHIIEPALQFARATLQVRLAPYYDDRLILGYESPVGEDEEYQLNVAKSAPWALSIDEWRTMAGQDPLPGGQGEVHALPLTYQLVAPAEFSVMTLPPTRPTLPEPDEEPDEESDDEPDEDSYVSMHRHVHDHPLILSSAAVALKQIGGPRTTDLALRLTEEMIAELQAGFAELRGSIDVSALRAAIEAQNIEAAVAIVDGADVPASLEAARQVLRQAVITVGGVATEQLVQALGLDTGFELTSQAALAELQSFGASGITNVSKETVSAVRAALTSGYAEGATPSQLAKQIQRLVGMTERDASRAVSTYWQMIESGRSPAEAAQWFETFAAKKIRQRAERIATNELLQAGTRGQQMVWEEAVRLKLLDQATVAREWITAADDRVCELCGPMNGQRAPIGQAYSNGVVNPSSTHVICRCSERLVFVRKR